MTIQLFFNTLFVISKNKYLWQTFLLVIGINILFYCLLEFGVKVTFELPNAEERWLVKTQVANMASIFITHFPLLIIAYWLENIEREEIGKRRFQLVPLSFSQLYISRLSILILAFLFFYIISMITWMLITLIQGFEMQLFSKYYFYIIFNVFIASIGYISLVAFCSFFLPNMYYGAFQLFFFLLMIGSQSIFIPSSYAYSFLRFYSSYQLYGNFTMWDFQQFPTYSCIFLSLILFTIFILEKKI
jgi:hypothetical protein